MDILAPIIVIIVLAAAVWFVSAPIRARVAGRETPAEVRDAQRRRDLEIERDQKYAEIRELEMDLRTGKLSEADYKVTDRQLRAEAVDILHALDQLGVGTEETPELAPSQRTEMSAVYSSFRDVSGILTPGLAWLVLLFSPLAGVFAATGLLLLAAWAVAGRIHPQLGVPGGKRVRATAKVAAGDA